MANSIEVPVRLSLEQAQSQAEELRRMLRESVQPNSSEFRAISTMIERAVTQAERLKQTMGESFKTSSGSKKFNGELQKTFDLLATATGRLKNVSAENIILSDSELQRAKNITTEIERLQGEIDSLSSKKIGSFFDNSTDQKLKDVADLANSLFGNISNMTFSGLSEKLSKETTTVNSDLEKIRGNIESLKNAQAAVGKDNGASFISEMIKNTQDATKLSAGAAKTVEDQLTTVFSKYQDLFNGKAFEIGDINTKSNIPTIMHNQFDAINNAIEPEIQSLDEQIQKYEAALQRLNNVQTTGFKKGGAGAAASKASAAEIKAAAEAVGVQLRDRGKSTTGHPEDLDAYKEYAEKAVQDALDAIRDSKSKFQEARTELINSVNSIFENIGESTQIKDKNGFKNVITSWLNQNGIDAGAKEIQNALASIMTDSFSGDVFQRIGVGISEYFTRALQEAGVEEGEAAAKVEALNSALNVLNGVITSNNGKITANKEKIAALGGQLEDMGEKARKAFGEKVDTNPIFNQAKGQYEQATQALQKYTNGLANLESKQQALGNIQNAVTRWMGFYQVLNLGKKAIQDMKNHIQELDTVMTQIAVVTNMSQDDLWGQIGKYSQIARQYGVAIKGVYEVSQIYYQQGLNQSDVMNLTTETLKMARIAGLDYATAADYMTTAIRGFKLEMTDAAHVTDVYSALAAKTASSTEELAVAISKTASSAEAVGSSFEATSAMMATMISVTRESATNIGTALKSVISRYGEMTSDPSKLVDSEGEEMSLNRVDKALKTIGITIQDVNGQFRDFDDVILELGEKWDTLDKNSQRYIATLMAGNRQQSRFLSLVGNIDEYKNALEIAQNAENAGELQTLKTLDSVDAKIEKMKVTVQEFYTSAGIQDLYKGILDTITNVMDAANNLPKAFGKIPAAALIIGAQIIAAIKNIVSLAIDYISMAIKAYKTNFNSIITGNLRSIAPQLENEGRKIGTRVARGIESGLYASLQANRTSLSKTIGSIFSAMTAVTSTIAAEQSIEALNDYGASTGETQDQAAAVKMYTAAGLQGAGAFSTILSGALMGGLPGALMGLASAIPSIISGITALNSGISMYNVTLERSLELSNKRVEAARQESVKAKGEVNDLQSSINKLKQLEEAQYSSAEAMQEYIDYRNQLIETYPELLSGYDSEYNAIIETSKAYEILAQKISLALQKQVEYDSNNRDNARLRAEAAKSYSQKLSEASQDKYSTATGKGVVTFITSGDLNQATYETQYERMSQAGAFSGVFDELISSNKKRAEDYASLGKYSEALDELREINKIILNESEAYTKLLEEQTSISYRQSSALLGATQKIEATYGAEEVVDFYNNNFLRSMFSSTIKYLHNAGNIDENNKVLSETFGEGELSLEEYGALLGDSLFKLYNNLLEDQQEELSQVIKNRDKYSSSDAYKKALESIIGQGLIPEGVWEGQEKDYADAQTSALDRLEAYSEKQSKNGDKYIDQFVALFEGETNLSSNYVNAILEDAQYYDSQINSGLLIYGNSIAEKMLAYWTAIGTITDENKQIELSDKLRAIDRQDTNELDKLIDNLENEEGYTEEGEIGQVVKALKEYRAALSVSINTLTAEYINNIKTAETDITDISKIQKSGFSKFEDMSKAFQQLNKAGFTGTWKEAFTFDDGVWKYSAEAYRIAISKINDTLEADNKNLTQRITALNTANDTIREQASKYNFFTEYNFDDFNKALRAFDSEQMKQFLANLFKITDEGVLNTITDQITAGIIPLGESIQEFYNNILAWIANQLGEAENQINGANQFIINLKLSQLDISGIAGGTEFTNEAYNRTLLFDALKAVKPDMKETDIQTEVNVIWSELKDGIFTTFEKYFPGILSRATKQAASQSDFEQYQNAISELYLGDPSRLSQPSLDLLRGLGIKVEDSMDGAVIAAGQLLQLIRGRFDSISDYNADAKTLLEKNLQLSQVNKQKAIYDFATNGISIDSIFNLADSLNQYIDEFINLTTGEIKSESLNKVLTYNQWTGTYDVTGTAEDFITALHDTFGLEIKKTSTEYLQIVENIFNNQAKRVSERNDLLVKARERQDQTAIREAIKDITFTNKGGFASLSAIESLANAIGKDVNLLIGDYIKELDAYALNVDITQLDLYKIDGIKEIIAESINAFIASLVDLISKGIGGKLSQTDVSTLKGNLGQLGLSELAENLDFTKTTEGLQLSQASAIQLYNEIKKIDRLQGEVIFKELSQSLADSNEKFKSSTGLLAYIKDLEEAIANENQRISAADGKVSNARLNQYEAELDVAKEILAVRSTTEDSSFNFMSNDIPGGQKNPINYISNWSKALKTLQDASKEITKGPKGELGGGFISYQDWYNIATEMDAMAMKTGNKFEFAGITLGDGMSHAAELIDKGIAALSVNTATGELEVSLGKMGISFDAAADSLNADVQDGIKHIAEAEINMLDSMISVLETIVAMEQLGDIDTDNDMTIELPEILIEGQTGDAAQYTKTYDTWRQNIISKLESQDKGYEDLQKAFKEVSINGKTLETIVKQDAKDFKEIDAQILSALYQASKSGNYDLDNIWQSVKETLAGIEGFKGQIEVGDMRLAISNGIVLEAKDGKYIVGGLEFDYSEYEEACRAAMLEKIGAKGEFTKIQGDLGETEYQGTITIGKNDIIVQTSGDKVKYLDANGEKWDSIDQVIASNFEIAKTSEKTQATTAQEFAYEAGYKVAPKITGIDTSNISQTQINNLVGKSLKDLQDAAKDTVTFEAEFGFKFDPSMTEEQLAELKAKLGIENKAIEMTISASAPTGEGADILAQLITENPIKREVKVDIVKGDKDEIGLINGNDATTTLTKEIAGITITKAAGFTVTGEDTIWAEITATKEYDAFTAYVSKLITEKGTGFTSDPGDAVWAEIKDSKEYEQFVAAVKSLVIQKIATGFTDDDGSVIWNEIKDSKEFDTFTAYVSKLIAEKGAGFTDDNGSAIWNEIKDSKEYEKFVAAVKSLVTQKIATGFINDNGSVIWNEITATKEFEAFTATVKALTVSKGNEYTTKGIDTIWSDVVTTKEYNEFTATVAKILVSKATEGFNTDDKEVWAEVITTNDYDKFTAYVAKVVAEKTAQGFEADDATIWAEIKDSKEYEKFSAVVSSIVAEKAATGFVDKTAEILPEGPIRILKDIVIEAGKITTEDPNKKLREEVYKGLHIGSSGEYLTTQTHKVEEKVERMRTDSFGNTYMESVTETKDVLNDKSQLSEYLATLQGIVSSGQTLSKIDLTNLNTLYYSGAKYIETISGENVQQIIEGIQAFNNLNLQNQTDQLTSISSAFAELSPTNLQAVAEAMQTLAINAQAVRAIPWDTIVGDINKINAPEADNVLANTDEIVRKIIANITVNYDNATDTEKALLTNSSVSRELIFTSNLEGIKTALEKIAEIAANIKIGFGLSAPSAGVEAGATSAPQTTTLKFDSVAAIGDMIAAAKEAANSINQTITDNLKEQTININANTKPAQATIKSFKALASLPITIFVNADTGDASAKIQALNEAAGQPVVMPVEVTPTMSASAGLMMQGLGGRIGQVVPMTKATGNVALAKGRQTLMGELGPELYVTHGHYYVAGQNGAEFVNLPDDAIVFNHIQTRKLLENGSGGRGRPVTNERKATSLATGNTSGPAMASAAAALQALKQIRAMWQSMLNASLSDLGQQAGGGGGGGGGKKKNTIDPGFIADLERWYNLLRQIDKLEKDINYQEQLRTKIQSDRIVNGKALYDSYKKSLAQLDQEVIDHQQLAFLQKDYYDKRRQTLEQETNYGKIFTFNEEGLMQYNDQAVMANGDRGGLFALGKLNAQNPDGSTVLSAEQQYKLLQSWGFGEDMVYDSSGKKITFGEDEEDESARESARQAGYTTAVQAFWDKADAWKDELDGLYDSYREQQEEILDADNKRNEILQAIVDNQVAIEDKVYNAIVDSRQRQIDDAQKERDAYEKNTQEFIDGLSKQLNKEREMYQQQQDSDSLLRLRRQLAILQRSGGSASAIRGLQDQITQKEKDAYFDSQQKQIDAIQEASNLEIERLDAQIDLMTETLEYQKTYGLLWEQVAQIMRGTPSEINNFITSNGNDWMNYSTTKWDEEYRLLNGQIELWASYKNDDEAYRTTWDGFPVTVQQAIAGLDEHSWHTYDEAMYELFGEKWEGVRDIAYKYYTDQYNKSSDPNVAALITNQTSEIYDMIQSAMGAKSSSIPLDSQAYQDGASKKGDGGDGGGAGNGGGTTDKKGTSLGAVTGIVEGAKSTESRTLHISYAKKCTAGLYAGYSIGGSPSGPSTLLVGESGTVSHNPNADFVQGGWSVSDESKCRVSGGTITALAPGYVTVTMQYWYRGTNDKKVDTTIPTGTVTIGSGGSVKKINTYETLLPYASGGMNEETGPAMLHGTKSRPEAVLNPEQTRMLKEDILGGGSNSLLSTLVAFKNTLNNTIDGSKIAAAIGSSTPASDSVVIEHAEVNLNATIANDYDARRAGTLVMDEMVKIARKNGIQNNIRR